MRMKLAGLMVAFLAVAVSAQQSRTAATQAARPAPTATRPAPPTRSTAPTLPPLAYICPMPEDSEVVEDKPGQCPKCGMQLVPVRLDSKFWCPTHQTLEVHDAPGKCPRDGKDLVQVTLNEFWTCPDSPDGKLLEPGACGDGKPRRIKYELAAHGDHNPKHGGQFFMASDQWHHLEGTYPSTGLFRAHFYDNFTKPMSPKGFSGSLVLLDKMTNKEVASYPLVVEPNNKTMVARIPAANAALPLNAAVKIKFKPTDKEGFFNFPFSKYTVEPPAAPATTSMPRPGTPASTSAASTTTAPSMRGMPSTSAPTPALAAADSQTPLILDSPLAMPPGLADATDEAKLPKDVSGLVKELDTRATEVGKLVSAGELAQVWLPAMATKTAALALDSHTAALPERQRAGASAAVKQIVMAAWDIDNYGDLGNGTKITEAYQRLTGAVRSLKAIYAQ